MQNPPETVAEAAAEAVRAMIGRGTIKAGANIHEGRLAEQLGVSRTPLREALNRLCATGLVELQPRRGFFATALSADELRDAYRLRPILDCAALEAAGLPDAARLARLKALNARFAAADDTEQRIDLDDSFHLALIAGCGNALQLDLIRMLMARTRRYEMAYFSEAATIEQSGDEHARIIAALEAGDLEAAVAALRANLSSGLAPMLRWLKKRKIPE
jgi:DNA-binding GntR family transcriptional regulator